jgi:hypothetical protein
LAEAERDGSWMPHWRVGLTLPEAKA